MEPGIAQVEFVAADSLSLVVLIASREAVERLIAAHDYHAHEPTADAESWTRAFGALRGTPGTHDNEEQS